MASASTCGRQHAPMGTPTSDGFEPKQPDLEKKKVVIDYSPGPDSISKVMRKRTLSMMELLGDNFDGKEARSTDFPKFSASSRGFSIEKHSCKPPVASKPDINCEAKQVEDRKSAKRSQCGMRQEDDVQPDQQFSMQQSDHRCRRVAPGQECKPKPKTKPCTFPQLSLALFPMPMPMDDMQQVRQPKSGKRADQTTRHSASTRFPQFEDSKGKKKLRVSFAQEAEEDITAMYTRCDPKWQERLANETAKKGRKTAAKENQSREQINPDIGKMPNYTEQSGKHQTVQQKQPSVKIQQETKRNITETQLNELQRCVGMYDDGNYPQETNAEPELPEAPQYRTPKKYRGSCWDMYQQESPGGSKESEQMEQLQCTESSLGDEKQQSGSETLQDAERLHQCNGKIYSEYNRVEFEANRDEEDEDDTESRKPIGNENFEKQATDKQRPGSSVLAELEVSRMEPIPIQQTKRVSQDYTLQIGVRNSTTGESFAENQQSTTRDQAVDKTRIQASPEDQQQRVRRCNSQHRPQALANQKSVQRQSRAEKPPCIGFQRTGGVNQHRRSESEPSMQRDRRISPSGQRPERSDALRQNTWKRDDNKVDPPPQTVTKCLEQTVQQRPKESTDILDACNEALRQDSERKRRREQAERAQEIALLEALKPKRKAAPEQNQPATTCPKVECHCSLHSEQTCKGPAKKRPVAKPIADSDCNKQTKESTSDRINPESACSEDAGKVEWVREGHLLVKLNNGKPSGAKVVSKGGLSDDIYSSGDQPVKAESSEATTPEQKTLEEETMEDSSMVETVPQPPRNDLLWGAGEGENTLETTDDDPVAGSKKKCCC
ncbi:hypothetical protein BOX15_Mlig018065g3 [Macrostomum lignano]|uniref:Uncharacterized protein n=1 Tax=Macrostomum lignano TaxID=282301 RepID=A0A267GA01_9PLAT|nr:hypothetical protein BOX15_Mlig018065g3 [Macrostomum lignano]